jgi:hypothetical protein
MNKWTDRLHVFPATVYKMIDFMAEPSYHTPRSFGDS